MEEIDAMREAYRRLSITQKRRVLMFWNKDLPLDVYTWSKAAQLNIRKAIQ